jgi:hypothetical protein
VGEGNKTVTVSGVEVNDGNSGANYQVSYLNNTTSSINLPLSNDIVDRVITTTINITQDAFVRLKVVEFYAYSNVWDDGFFRKNIEETTTLSTVNFDENAPVTTNKTFDFIRCLQGDSRACAA